MTPDHNPARKSLESERAEALADRLAVFTKLSPHDFFEQSLSGSQLQLIVTALRRLAAQNQKPVAWHSPTDSATPFVKPYVKEAMLPHVAAQYSVPLYLSTPPASGWDNVNVSRDVLLTLISALDCALGDTDPSIDPDYTNEDVKRDYPVFWVCQQLSALRSKPTDTVATVAVKPLEWEDADEGMCTKWRAAALGGNYELVNFGKDDPGFAVNFHWGRPLSFWFIQGEPDEWGDRTGPKIFPTLDEAKAAAQADYMRRILSALSHQPDAAETTASAEARMREAITDWFGQIADLSTALRQGGPDPMDLQDLSGNLERACEIAGEALEALSAHTSDCDKHGCMGDMAPGDPKDLAELLAKPSVLEPSEPRGCPTPGACSCPLVGADVTVERAQLWRHKKRGTTYRILHNNAPMQEEQTEGRRLDGETMAVYQDINSGSVYVRPVVEFYDGRFEALPLSNMGVTK